MNNISLSAFVDELVKIALPTGSFALSGTKAIVSEGAHGAGNLAKVLHQGEQFTHAARAAEAGRHAQLQKLLSEGKFDPKTHSYRDFMSSGKVVPKPASAIPTPAAASSVKPGPSGTAIVSPEQMAAAPMPAAAAAKPRPVTQGPPPAVVKPGMFPQQKPAAPARGWKKLAPHVGIGLGAAGLGYEAAT